MPDAALFQDCPFFVLNILGCNACFAINRVSEKALQLFSGEANVFY